MSKRQKNTYSNKSREFEIRSEDSVGTEQLQKKAARSTEGVFSQMLTRSK
jgi:hypothetical protein